MSSSCSVIVIQYIWGTSLKPYCLFYLALDLSLFTLLFIYFSVYVWVCACVCSHIGGAYLHTCAYEGTKMIACVSLDHSPLFSLRQSLSIELRTHWSASFPQGSPSAGILTPSAGTAGWPSHLPTFYVGWGISTPARRLMQLTLYPSSPLPSPKSRLFSKWNFIIKMSI